MKEQNKKEIGRPLKYNEETKVIAFRVPVSCESSIREVVNKILIKLEK